MITGIANNRPSRYGDGPDPAYYSLIVPEPSKASDRGGVASSKARYPPQTSARGAGK